MLGELAGAGVAAQFEHCDLTDVTALRRSIAAIRARLGPIEVLVNNAASDERHATEQVEAASACTGQQYIVDGGCVQPPPSARPVHSTRYII